MKSRLTLASGSVQLPLDVVRWCASVELFGFAWRGRLLAMASWLLLVGFGVPIGVVVLLDFLARRGR
ncbi:hypothetical protein VZQ01_21165 [Myxococcus faecalis]|uniref:hypothetical protein n=1 Tax=Myxococcus faecalis TaxID=3115646 RepID=UPI0024CB6A38|nr:hypothetical protein MFMH1_81710 [Myxococcus sp. MH1]